ncbi:hypothetical protein JTE90_008166 [Oedothorax gibbosus]|uniref:Uncharacterized protein n=1 Tax=Oedothorax gibbosus TaxID=931172 RepID=A0AAV6VH46_9ARAC|nr:hypothetical protein JTE90_008166 [Oedothorax gibbosus]
MITYSTPRSFSPLFTSSGASGLPDCPADRLQSHQELNETATKDQDNRGGAAIRAFCEQLPQNGEKIIKRPIKL